MPCYTMVIRASAIFLLWLVCGCSCQGPPPSPCPDVFSYQRDSSGRWFGIVTILPPATFAEARLIFRMTVANYRLDKGYGNIQVLGGDAEVQEISKSAFQGVRRKVQFLINFPPVSTIPRVTEVVINDVTFCSDVGDYGEVGKIELKYVLKTGLHVPPTNGFEFSTVTGLHPGNSIPRPPVLNQNGWNQNIPPPPVQRPTPNPNNWNQITFATHRTSPPPAPTRITNKPQRRKTTTTTTPEYHDEEDDDNKVCGRNSNDHNFLVVHGSEAKKEEWPWHSALYKNDKSGLTYICGGTLVSKRHIVTAAHCVYDRQKNNIFPKEKFTLFLGKHDLANWSEKSQQHVTIENIVVHPKYTSANFSHDAAIIEISSAKYNDFVRPACLWDQPTTSLANKIGTVVGWGLDEKATYPTKRRVVEMPVVDDSTCINSDPFFRSLTDNSNYCAGFRNGSGACQGDSGGGMMFKTENRVQGQKTWYLRGVVSFSKPDLESKIVCDTNHYTVFTDVAKLMAWIREEMQKT